LTPGTDWFPGKKGEPTAQRPDVLAIEIADEKGKTSHDAIGYVDP